jgi:type IV secretory pathway TraG/TraD family ATPase VirD4
VYGVYIITGLADVLYLASREIDNFVVKYFTAIWEIYKALYYQKAPAGIDWGLLFGAGLPAGAAAYLLYQFYDYARPEWVKQRKGLYGTRGNKKEFNVKLLGKISGEKHPANGTLIGVDNNGKKVIITDEELNGHCLLLGATGAGKTTTLLNFIESAAQRGLPAVIVDGKGDDDFVGKVRHLAEKHGRKLYFFSMTEIAVSKHYNPLRHGNYTELKDKLISLTEWTEPHYKMQAERYLQTAVKVLMAAGITVDLVSIAEEIAPKRLETLAAKLPEEVGIKVFDTVDEAGNTIFGLLNRLAVFAESEIGWLFTDTGDANTIDLLKVMQEKAMVLFSLNSLMFAEYSRLLGRLIVIDLKTAAARLLSRKQNIYCIFDEFGVFAGLQVIDLVNKSRAAGFHIILSTQELADLRFGGGNDLMEQVLGNTNIKIIHRQDVPASAELLASLIGTKDDYMITQQVNQTGATGMGTVKQEKSFIVHPDDIKRLSVGEVYMIKKFPHFDVNKLIVKLF